MSTSRHDTLLTTIRDLGRRRARERRGLALAEGVRLLEEALSAGIRIRGAAVSPALEGTPRGRELLTALGGRGVPLVEVSQAELEKLADTEHPQGVVAVIEPRVWSLADLSVQPGGAVLVLDGVQDPGNVGAILRTALALGAAGVVVLKGTAELDNPKVLRGSMGAAFRLPAVASGLEEFLAWVRSASIELWVSAAGAPPLESTMPQSARPPVALVLGNEGAGVSSALSRAADRRIAIRLAPGVESLNVAVAAGILLYEVMRGG